MALSTWTGTITQSTSVSNQSYAVGFVPKAIIIWTAGNQADMTVEGDIVHSFGVAVSAADQRVIATAIQDAAAAGAPLSGKRSSDAACLLVIQRDAGQTVLAQAALVSMDSAGGGGFTLSWSVTDNTGGAHPRLFHVLALGGTDITAVKGGSAVAPSTTGVATSTSDVGFTPDLLFLFTTNQLAAVANSVNGGSGIGITSGVGGQMALGGTSLSGGSAGSTKSYRYQRTDRALVFPNTSGAAALEATLTSMDATGFTLTYSVTTSGAIVFYLAIKGVQANLSVLQEPMNAPPFSDSHSGVTTFAPKALFVLSDGAPTGSAVITTHRRMIGAATSSGSQRSAWYGDSNNATTSVAKRTSDAGAIIDFSAESPATTSQKGVASLVSLDPTGYTLNWSVTDNPNGHEFIMLAIGSTAALTPPTDLVISGVATGLSGAASPTLTLSLLPPGSGFASETSITLTVDGRPSVVFTPGNTVILHSAVTQALFGFQIPDITGSSSPQTITVRAALTGVNAALFPFSIYLSAGTVLLSGPSGGPADVPSDVFTVSLPAGTNVPGTLPATLTDGDEGGTFDPPVVLLSAAVRSGTTRYTPQGLPRTVQIGLENLGTLTPPPTVPYAITAPSDFVLACPRTVATGMLTYHIKLALREGLTVSNPVVFTLGDDQQSGAGGTWYLESDPQTPITQATLSQTVRTVWLLYRPADGVGASGVATVHLTAAASQGGLVAPQAAPLDVYDPALYASQRIGALYPAYMNTLSFTVRDDIGELLYDHPTDRTIADGAAVGGFYRYWADILTPLAPGA